jgi:hypothetical protein
MDYIQERGAEYDSRAITQFQLLRFWTQMGDSWLLKPADHPAVPLARDGDPLPAYIEETGKNFTIGWTGICRIDGQTSVCSERDSGHVRTILGYPTWHVVKQSGS